MHGYFSQQPSDLEGFRAMVEQTAQPYENVEDILVGSLALGERRARLLNRLFDLQEDLTFGLSLFCWNPFKPPPLSSNQAYLVNNRWMLFNGASKDVNVEDRFNGVVPETTLTMELPQLFQMLQYGDIRNIINFFDMQGEVTATI
jgi:hypothetical protein